MLNYRSSLGNARRISYCLVLGAGLLIVLAGRYSIEYSRTQVFNRKAGKADECWNDSLSSCFDLTAFAETRTSRGQERVRPVLQACTPGGIESVYTLSELTKETSYCNEFSKTIEQFHVA